MKLWGHKQKKREVVYKDKAASLLFAVFISLLILLALNISMLLPMQISSLFYQIELMILQHFNYPVYLQRWELYILILFFASFGYYAFPVLYVPSTGMNRLYFYTWVEGDTRFFRTIAGYVQINKDFLERKGLRWAATGNVSTYYEGNVLVLQTREMEVTASNIWKRSAYAYAKYAEERENDLVKGIHPTLEEIRSLLVSMRGGGGE